jgi:rhamnosyltransferase
VPSFIVLTTVAIPVLNGARLLPATLAAVRSQRLDGELELVVCDSGSVDGSVEVARSYGARVLEIAPHEFGHGPTRNLLMAESRGDHVAFLTQDAIPADELWLSRLLAGFALAEDVGLTFGPYRPRPGASPMVQRELSGWFGQLAPGGRPRVDRLASSERDIAARDLLGPRGFFTDANGCVARAAWAQAPFRDLAYAEDHLLAHDMLRAGWAKVYLPEAAVVHSHDYSTRDWLRRSFDEARAVKDIYGWQEPLALRTTTLNLYGRVGADLRWARAHQLSIPATLGLLARSAAHHAARITGAVLGSRYERLAPAAVRRLSLEGRGR